MEGNKASVELPRAVAAEIDEMRAKGLSDAKIVRAALQGGGTGVSPLVSFVLLDDENLETLLNALRHGYVPSRRPRTKEDLVPGGLYQVVGEIFVLKRTVDGDREIQHFRTDWRHLSKGEVVRFLGFRRVDSFDPGPGACFASGLSAGDFVGTMAASSNFKDLEAIE